MQGSKRESKESEGAHTLETGQMRAQQASRWTLEGAKEVQGLTIKQADRFGSNTTIQPHDFIALLPVMYMVACTSSPGRMSFRFYRFGQTRTRQNSQTAAADGGFTVPVACMAAMLTEGTRMTPSHSGIHAPVTGYFSSLQR